MEAILWDKLEQRPDKAAECMESAMKCTIPDPKSWDGKNSILCGDEINLFLIYLKYQLQMGRMGAEEADKICGNLRHYVETRVDDVFEKARIYPRVICFQIHITGEQMEVKERIQLEYQALAALQKTSEIYDMPEVLRLLIRDLQEIGASEAKRYEKQRQALVEVMEEHGFCTEFQLEIWYHVNERICIMNEYLYAGRMEKQMTQEDVSDGICAVETYSRIETGKRTASRKNYLKLAERLDMNWGYYRGQIVTDDYEDFSLMTEQRIAVYQSKLPEAEKLLEQLKQKLSLTEIENRQYVDFMHLVIEKQKENMTWEEALEEYKRILAYTISDVYHINRIFDKDRAGVDL